MSLKGKVVLITGSTTGIGKAIALRCATEGARVVVHGLEKDWGDDVCRTIGKDASVFCLHDLADPSAPQQLIATALNHFGKLDVLVNNAAWVASSHIGDTTPELLQKMLYINTVAPYALIRAALPALSQNKGNVLNIGSVNAWCGEPGLLAYSISKGALTTVTRNLGDVLFREHGVRVNQINPGWVLTEKEAERKRDQGVGDDWYKDLSPVHAPSGRLLSPDEMATAALYWIADTCGPVSGQVVDLEQYPLLGRNLPKH